jgi:hypothetical protein
MQVSALYGYGLESKRYPAVPQCDALLAFGVEKRRVLIEPRQSSEKFDSMVADGLRNRHDDVVAVRRFHLLAPGPTELKRRVKMIHAKAAVIVETESQRRSDNTDDLVDMMCEAHAAYNGRLLDSKTASEMGKNGAKARKPNDLERMPVAEARPIWRAKHHRNWQEALAAVNADTSYRGYSKNLAYDLLGPRDVKPGRRRK